MILLNEKLIKQSDALISPTDRGLLLGDGLFETLNVVNKKIQFFNLHISRLNSSLHKIHLEYQVSEGKLAEQVLALCSANQLTSAIVRLTITRGVGPRGIGLSAPCQPTVLVTATEPPMLAKSQRLMTCTNTCVNERSILASIKSLNYLDNVLAREQAVRAGFDDAILLNTREFVAETSVANIFIFKAGKMITPKISDGALPGVVRSVLIEKFDCVEQSITMDDLYAADEVFMTNSVIGAMPVVIVDDVEFQIGETTRLVQYFLNESRCAGQLR